MCKNDFLYFLGVLDKINSKIIKIDSRLVSLHFFLFIYLYKAFLAKKIQLNKNSTRLLQFRYIEKKIGEN